MMILMTCWRVFEISRRVPLAVLLLYGRMHYQLAGQRDQEDCILKMKQRLVTRRG